MQVGGVKVMNSTVQNFEMENLKNTNPKSRKDEEFDQAVDRVYSWYGSDLSAFARDVQRDMQKIQCAEHPQTADSELED
jgi:hypothetical protein